MDSNVSPVDVLVVANDEQAVLQPVSSTLEKAGFAVTGAPTSASALDRCRHDRLHPELAVIDTTIPGIDLQDLVSQLHQISPNVRVLMLSGEAPTEAARNVRARWHGKLLPKPFRRSQLLGQVLTLMDEPMVLTA
jgi:two-component system, cell cycle sensor histidine kinase and response regulator CckA